jgi:hypothetical protein
MKRAFPIVFVAVVLVGLLLVMVVIDYRQDSQRRDSAMLGFCLMQLDVDNCIQWRDAAYKLYGSTAFDGCLDYGIEAEETLWCIHTVVERGF